MNMNSPQILDPKLEPSLDYITEFKEKTDFEDAINSAWRRAEPECVENLIEHSQLSEEMSQKIYDT
ncbi:hypothetical protein DQE84_16095, partial [Staphylococcus warneri]